MSFLHAATATTTVLVIVVLGGVAYGSNELRIHNASEFISFSNDVNNGTNYSRTTVYLDSDIDFTSELSKKFEPIGNLTIHFQGVFDGQGHSINGLKFQSSSFFFHGLFGYGTNSTIRNIVIGSSSSITSSYNSSSGDNSYLASTVVYCVACLIENIVNMADVTYSGVSEEQLHFGGIAGWLEVSEHRSATVRNCVNYGTLRNSGDVRGTIEIGGIVSIVLYSHNKTLIQNCANYGLIINNGSITLNNVFFGGIVSFGHMIDVTIENCLSVGRIETSTESIFIGSILKRTYGAPPSDSRITHCFWTGDVGYDNDPKGFNITMSNSYRVGQLNKTTADELNSYKSGKSGWSSWFMLHLNGGRINDINQADLIVTQSQFPDPAIGGNTFVGWFKDAACTQLVDSQTSNGIDLYAGWEKNLVVFDGNGGNTPSKATMTVTYGSTYGTLATVSRGEHTFAGWFTEEGEGQGKRVTEETTVSIGSDHTLYAHWTINNYTITFVFNNGIENDVRILNFDETIVYPENPTKEGYTFNGWSPRPDRVPSEDVTITAQWTINNYTITFVFGNGTEDEVRVLNFNEAIVYPENPTKEGHTFSGWTPRPDRVPAENVTVTAQWIEEHSESSLSSSSESEKPSEYVEIVFGKKDLKEEEIREIIRKYTSSEFVIEKFENDEDEKLEGTRVIIKFVDKETAQSFIEELRASSSTKSTIRKVGFIHDEIDSFSSFLCPLYLLSITLHF